MKRLVRSDKILTAKCKEKINGMLTSALHLLLSGRLNISSLNSAPWAARESERNWVLSTGESQYHVINKSWRELQVYAHHAHTTHKLHLTYTHNHSSDSFSAFEESWLMKQSIYMHSPLPSITTPHSHPSPLIRKKGERFGPSGPLTMVSCGTPTSRVSLDFAGCGILPW